MIDINELRQSLGAVTPEEVGELLDRLEAAEKSDAESIAMYRKARDERDTLRAKIETAENDAAHQKALAASALRVAEGWERKCGELRAEVIYWKEQKEPGAAGWRALARILQAKIDAMEQQEPVDLNYIELMNSAQKIVESYVYFRRFIASTPLENDIAVWMADFVFAQLGAKGE